MTEYRYRLGKKAGPCPQCGRRTFKYYIDTVTGNILDPRCGRCNRENNCRYHEPPRKFIGSLPSHRRSPLQPMPAPQRPATPSAMTYFNDKSQLGFNNLYRAVKRSYTRHLPYCGPVPTIESTVKDVFSIYGVGHSSLFGNAMEFPLYDRFGSCRSVKVMGYDESGHRLKLPDRPSVTFLHTQRRLPDFNFVPCFFGEVLTELYPDRKVVVVESEKSALVLSCYLRYHNNHRYIVLATGGASNLSATDENMRGRYHRMAALSGRDVVLVPDADMVDKWHLEGARLSRYCNSVRVVDVRRAPLHLTGSQDVADCLMDDPLDNCFSWMLKKGV